MSTDVLIRYDTTRVYALVIASCYTSGADVCDWVDNVRISMERRISSALPWARHRLGPRRDHWGCRARVCYIALTLVGRVASRAAPLALAPALALRDAAAALAKPLRDELRRG